MSKAVGYLYGDKLWRADLVAVEGDKAVVFVHAWRKRLSVQLSRVFPSLALESPPPMWAGGQA